MLNSSMQLCCLKCFQPKAKEPQKKANRTKETKEIFLQWTILFGETLFGMSKEYILCFLPFGSNKLLDKRDTKCFESFDFWSQKFNRPLEKTSEGERKKHTENSKWDAFGWHRFFLVQMLVWVYLTICFWPHVTVEGFPVGLQVQCFPKPRKVCAFWLENALLVFGRLKPNKRKETTKPEADTTDYPFLLALGPAKTIENRFVVEF